MTTKPLIVGRSTLRTQTDATILSQQPTVLAALGLGQGDAGRLFHNVLHKMEANRHPEDIVFPVGLFRVHATSNAFTIIRGADVVRVFKTATNVSAAGASTKPSFRIVGADLSISNVSVEALQEIANVVLFDDYQSKRPQQVEGEHAALERAVAEVDAATSTDTSAPGEEAVWTAADTALLTEFFRLGPLPWLGVRDSATLNRLRSAGLVEIGSAFAFLTAKGVEKATVVGAAKGKANWYVEERDGGTRYAQIALAGADPVHVLTHLESDANLETRQLLKGWNGFAGDADLAIDKQHLGYWIALAGRTENVAYQFGRVSALREAMRLLGIETRVIDPRA